LFFAALFLIIARFLSVWSGTPFPVALVTSDSMEPSLMEGDIVAWTPERIEDLKVGDVVVFKSYVRWPDEKIVVHRIYDIETSNKGNILLTTKGDKNDWTDQKGPHIPEPYIREDHLMGKAISIGQQPIKIPFVGMFGIWINEGFSLISQPTASKNTINYVGVFAPLTISAVILVLLVFILPEKAKTIKEKIRLNIFGRKPLNLKKTLITFLIAYILFFTMIHAFAYDTMTASVGINDRCPDSGLEFGRIRGDRDSFSKNFPVINPGAMPVKGIVFAKGEMEDIVTKKIFELDKGDEKTLKLKAVTTNVSKNGSYTGDIMMYSSPFWLMFPDNVIKGLYNWNAEATVYTLDILAAVILTSLTIILLASITFIGDKTTNILIDSSWRRPAKIIIKKNVTKKLYNLKKRVKSSLSKNIGWILNTNILEKKGEEKIINNFKKPVLASLVLIPIIFLVEDQIAAIILSVVIAGITAYFISCKIRKKLLLTGLITISLVVIYMIIKSNIIILEKEASIVELLSLSFGVIGVYTLILTFFMIPLIFMVWIIVRYFRNVKEEKEPLLTLEGRCDL